MAENDIPLDQKAIERALIYPHFRWEDTIDGVVSYPNPGMGLQHNLFPKEKKKGKKKGGAPRAKSPKKRKWIF